MSRYKIVIYYIVFFYSACLGLRTVHADQIKNKIADIISRNHYLHPAPDTIKAIKIDELNDYLQTLDPYSKYYTRADYKQQYKRTHDLIRIGSGVKYIGGGKNLICVPFKGGPAYEAGIKRPLLLLKKNGKVVTFKDLKSSDINKKTGQKIELLTKDAITGMTRTYTLRTDLFELPSVELIQEQGVYLIRIHTFNNDETQKQLDKHIKTLIKEKQKIIIDLRYCPGGSFIEAVNAASRFLPVDTPMVTLEDNEKIHEFFISKKLDFAVGLPVYLLTSQYTASAGEIFTMILQQNSRAIVIGEKTEGKFLAQRYFELEDGSALRLSVFKIVGRHDMFPQNKGIVPDIEILPDKFIDTNYLMNKGVALANNDVSFVCQEKIYNDYNIALGNLAGISFALKPTKLETAIIRTESPAIGWMACLGPKKSGKELDNLKKKFLKLFEEQKFKVVKPFN